MRRYRAATALLLLAPQTPLLFMGQEFCASNRFMFFADHNPELRKLVYEMFSKPEALQEVLTELKNYESLKLPEQASKPAATTPAATTAAAAAKPATPAAT